MRVREAARLAETSAAPYRASRDASTMLAEVALWPASNAWPNANPYLGRDLRCGVRAFEELERAYLAFARDEPAFYAAMSTRAWPWKRTRPGRRRRP